MHVFCFEVEMADMKQLSSIKSWKDVLNNSLSWIVEIFIIWCSVKEYKEAFNFRVQIEDTIKNVKEFKKAIRCILFVMIIFLYFCSWHSHPRVYAKLLSRCFIFLFSIQSKQVHSLNTESSIIVNISTQISFLFFLGFFFFGGGGGGGGGWREGGYGKTKTRDQSIGSRDRRPYINTQDPGPGTQFFYFSKTFIRQFGEC